jgi:hypothetical protein
VHGNLIICYPLVSALILVLDSYLHIMGYFCFICDGITSENTINELVRHFNYRHGIAAMQKCKVKCGQGDCAQTFDGVHSYRMHLKRFHPTDPYPVDVPASNARIAMDLGAAVYDVDGRGEEPAVNSDSTASTTEPVCIENIHKMITDFLVVLKAKGVTQSVVDFVCQGVINILFACTQFCAVPSEGEAGGVLYSSLVELESMCDSFSMNSSYMLKKYLRDCKGLVEPREICVGKRTEHVQSVSDGTVVLSAEFVPETIQYISVISTLEKLLNDSNHFKLFNSIAEYYSTSDVTEIHPLASETIRSFSDGELFKTHPLYTINKEFLQLNFFFDEFETANPLGSKANIHKIGAVYMSVKNLPAALSSQLMNIFPVIYCYSSDVKNYNFDAILQPLLSDLKALEKGVQMVIRKKSVTVHAAVVMWSGDNLGNHQLFGFSQNFNSDLCCHFCYSSKDDRQTCFREHDCVMRTKSSHIADCCRLGAEPNSGKDTGVYRTCCLTELQYFSVPDNICPDAMHDILEGSLQYEIKLVLQQFITVDKKFTLNELNSRILAFAYGLDSKNKPQPISTDRLTGKEKKLGMNASQAWCFGRYFCLLIGDLVEDCNCYLHLVHLLIDICDIIFAPVINVSLTHYLEEIISSHHALFRELFPNSPLIPKQHFLIHYPSKIRKLGPCVQYWSMRFESKHASAKEFCRVTHNFQNICKSIAWQQQIRLCTDWMSIQYISAVDVGTGSAVLPCTLSVPDLVFQEAGIPLFEEIYLANYVKVCGSKYKTGDVVILSFENDWPTFGAILHIMHASGKVTFVVQKLFTVTYSSHYHAYEVERTDDRTAVGYLNLADWHPLSLHTGFGQNAKCQYIVPRYELLTH